jgi:hypothetical protein
MERWSSCTCRKTSVTEEPLPTTHNAEGWRSCTYREKPETGLSLENTSVNVTVWEAIEAKAYVIFKMIYMKKVVWRIIMEIHHGENIIKCSYMKG